MKHSTKAPTAAERARFEALQEEWLPVVGYEARYLVSNFAKKFGVSVSTVHGARRGLTWKEVPWQT